MTRLACALSVILLSLARAHGAETIPPKPDRYFNDYAHVVSPEAALRMNEQLAQFERDTSNQIVVAVYPKMQSDSDIADYTRRVALAWDIGQKLTQNGVALFVFTGDRKMFIQTSHGVEGALPDVTCFDITERHIKPKFRAGDYEGGLATGIDLICKAIRGEYKGDGQTALERSGSKSQGAGGLLTFLCVLFLLLLLMRASRRRGGYRYTSLGGPFITGGWGGSSWSGGSGGWSSGGGGGGFSGFSGGGGGGGFGGGGAGSSW